MDVNELFERVRASLGISHLQTAPRSSVMRVEIPETSREFLADVGLPKYDVLGMRFNHLDRLPYVQDIITKPPAPLSVAKTRMYALGELYGVVPAIEPVTGNVYRIDLDGDDRSRFVNSRIELFGVFLAECDVHRRRTTINSADHRKSMAHLKASMKSEDERALVDEENWWSVVLEELDSGLL